MVKSITIQEDLKYDFKSTAYLPILYRNEFGAEFFKDIDKMEEDITVGFNVAYAMYKHANEKAEPMDKWLGHFEIMGLIRALPELVVMINEDFKQDSSAKKKSVK